MLGKDLHELHENDNYGRGWTYRLFSELWTEPDVPESGKRHLTIRRVYWSEFRPVSHPIPEDVFAIDHEEAVPEGHTTEEIEVDLERMRKALDEPVMILAEWRSRLVKMVPVVTAEKADDL
jgi:hypothetical protein